MTRSVPDDSARSALRRLAADPLGQLVGRWNWKSALASSLWRGAIFAALAARGGWRAAGAAAGAEAILQGAAAGFSGAAAQAFHRVRPAWQGVGAAAGLVLCIQHPLEIALHRMRGTPHWHGAVLVSMGFSVAAAAANIGLMRRGFMIVGKGVGQREAGPLRGAYAGLESAGMAAGASGTGGRAAGGLGGAGVACRGVPR